MYLEPPIKLKKKDVIILEPQKIGKLFSWRDNNKELVRNYTPILEDVVINAGGLFIHVLKDSNEFKFTVYDNNNLVLIEKLDTNTGLRKTELEKLKGLYKSLSTTEQVEDYKESVISVYCSIMAFMEHNKEVVNQKDIRNRVVKKKNKKGKKKEKVTYLKRRVYELSDSFNNISEGKATTTDKRGYTSPKEPFKVRGHWRNYKDGKKVWIPSYTKNQNNDEQAKPKTYKLT